MNWTEEQRKEVVMADLKDWAERHGLDPAIVLVNAAEAYLRNQGAAGYAEIHEV